ncbi:SDR family oxidoreductase [Haliangium sp.]|uniref:SDR family oxidoreductase n=1 Tax=Haliangium sp. TaxID=2663208 RepID=UPI003D0B3A0E
MSEPLNGKTCVVTGASSGIGRAVAQALAAQGARVVGYARRFEQERLLFLPGPGEVTELALDITDEAQVSARFAELPTIDVLVNAAGLGLFAPLVETELEALRALLAVHVTGTFACCREAAMRMQATLCGHIVTIGSIASTRYLPGCGAYAVAKSAQAAMSRALVEELRAHQVRVTHLLLGAVDTSLWQSAGVDEASLDRSRMLQPADVAEVVVEALTRPGLSLETMTILPPGGVL